MMKLTKKQYQAFQSFIQLVGAARLFTCPEGVTDEELPEALKQGYEQAVDEVMDVKRICGVSRQERREVRKWLMAKMRDRKFFDIVAASLLLPTPLYMQPFDGDVEGVDFKILSDTTDEETVTNSMWSCWLDAVDDLHARGMYKSADDVIDLFAIPTAVLPPMTKRISDADLVLH